MLTKLIIILSIASMVTGCTLFSESKEETPVSKEITLPANKLDGADLTKKTSDNTIKSAVDILESSTFFTAVYDAKFGIGAQSALGLINEHGEIFWVWYENIPLPESNPRTISISLTYNRSKITEIISGSNLEKKLLQALKISSDVIERRSKSTKEITEKNNTQEVLMDLGGTIKFIQFRMNH